MSAKNNPEKFWSNVTKSADDECWLWQKYRNKDGYGITGYLGKILKTHRLAYELTYGKIPENLHVLHKCDNPPCCNPNHLFVGTHLENIKDCVSKGRFPKRHATFNGKSKLTEKEVIEIRRLYASGDFTQIQLGKIFGVYFTTIGKIVRNENWTK